MIFSCDRTCRPFCEECHFAPILRELGPNEVFSHTTRVAVEFRDSEALSRAVLAMGGTIMGTGHIKLFTSYEDGFGFCLPNWRFPLVLKANQKLAYDDYGGRWGNKQDIDALTQRYTVEKARAAAEEQGWYCENQTNGDLLIFHPDGGTITVTKNATVDLCNFVGTGCVAVGNVIEAALGRSLETTNKPEMLMEQVQIQTK